jgi:CheY-like chemotaxis protein
MRDRKIRLLMVDDHDEFVSLVSELAEDSQFSFDFLHVKSGKEALDKIKSWQPSAVLLDAHVEDMSSFDIARMCACFTTIVITSEFLSNGLEARARESGAAAYAVKSDVPEDVDHLLNDIAFFSEGMDILH